MVDTNEMLAGSVAVSDSGDAALRVWAHGDERERNWRLVHKLANSLEEALVPGVTALVPTYDSLLVEFDPIETSRSALRSYLTHAIDSLDLDTPLSAHPRQFRVPVVYGGELGPDLELVAAQVGLSAEEVIELHHTTRYTVRCLGAPGGSPMLDGPAYPRPVPRLGNPRISVPQGAVSVAGRQATITPAVAPGGWPLIGQTPLSIIDLSQEPLVPYAPGDIVTFYPIDRAQFDAMRGQRLEVFGE